jgi:acyl-CoA synthetase (AMP-forming)/AMP-acid ligase II
MIDFSSENNALFDSITNTWWTYQQLGREVERLADKLTSSRKQLAFAFCDNSLAAITFYLACLKSKQAIALLDARLDQSTKAGLIESYQPEIVFDVDALCNYNSVDKDLIYERQAEKQTLWMRVGGDSPEINDELALLLPTSGTTGSAKFVRLSRQNLESNAHSIIAALAISATDRTITSLPLSYSYGLSVINSHLLAGASIVLTNEGLMSKLFWDLLRSYQCSSLAGVPYSYEIIDRLGLDRLNVPSLNTLTQAGGRLNNDLIAKFSVVMKERGGRFFVMYGQTEATARISVLPAECLPNKLGSVGCAIPLGRLSINREAVEAGSASPAGEVVYSGPNVMLGYADSRKALSLGDELKGVLSTGDIGYLDSEGFLYITGRSKRFSKIYGYRVNLDEVERIMQEFGPAAVIGSDEKIVIFCGYVDSGNFAKHKQYLAAKLHLDHNVFEFRRIESLPQTKAGKIDYQSLHKEMS